MTPGDYHIILMQIVFRVCVCGPWTVVRKLKEKKNKWWEQAIAGAQSWNIAMDRQTYLIITVILSWVLFLLVCIEF